MVGAVGLTLKRPVSTPTVDVFAQHNVDFQKVLVHSALFNLFNYLYKPFFFLKKRRDTFIKTVHKGGKEKQ
jgi:hypothetical protein